ncbi:MULTISPECIES: transcriptional regulator [Corynebacterium]|uniref:transcriptional regulator n=1 Tax=Corynebacterium TaxID=1716 RepID=UPI0003B812D7|nr:MULTISPECIES: transcriptional regulator [Corynebacterium]ERS41863.1 hypothetical protein HMPREF1293_02015 [Corynebacterium sp. KPL1996]ERS44692.1 hypothetical protein HMPREF1287_01186 [Corynebacterium sp. KPL1986]ERS72617.1 hypothetical protein HMPREF1295_01545 [Corynebacterium sp. KPL1998]ERS73924.1 hypothetical protein HMPREF1300_00906 [Corynebacterium sp. KPL2004]MCT1410010.1 transcriptional regulator [Corynebacterium accolens]
MNSNEHETWLQDLIGGDSMRTAAQRTDYAQTTISRQLSRGHLSPEMVIALCRAYDRSPVQGLVETGYINEYEVEGVDLAIALHDATNEQLLNEIMRRSDPEARYLFGADGDSEVVDIDDAGGAAVFDIQKARVDPSDYDDGTVREFDYDESEYAADSSPDEQKIREERGEDPID